MPELPEVETMCRGIAGVVGSTIRDVQRLTCDLKPIRVEPRPDRFRSRVVGRQISQIGRVGKRVIVHLDNQDAIVFEPRMTGLVLVTKPPDVAHLRFRLDLAGRPVRRVWYWDRRGLGSVRLLTPRQFDKLLGPHRLGPDALAISADELREQFCKSRRAIKVALLDQRAIAGIGNLYASEILHVAGVHPTRRPDRLTHDEWSRVYAAMIEVLDEAIRLEGSTLDDGTYRNALNNPGRYQNRHRVYKRAGRPCAQCGAAEVRRIVQAQRSTFFCPVCQPRRPGVK